MLLESRESASLTDAEGPMRGKEAASTVLAVVGAILLLISLGADLVGGWPGFGRYQIVGAIAGVILIFVAWFLTPTGAKKI